MNKPQRLTLITGLIIIAVMSPFPPLWHPPTAYVQGYRFLFHAPYSQSPVDLSRLAARVLFVAAVCAALCSYQKSDS